MFLELVHGEDLVECQRVGVVDHAGERQRPAVGVDLGHPQGGVDPVEGVVRGDVAGDAGNGVERSGGDGPEERGRCGRGVEPGEIDSLAGDLGRALGADPAGEPEAGHGDRAGTGRPAEEGAPGGTLLPRVFAERGEAGGPMHPGQEEDQGGDAEAGGDEGHDPAGERRRLGVPGRGEAAQQAERGEADGADPRRNALGEVAQECAEKQGGDRDAGEQRGLARGAEVLDARLGGLAGRDVDDPLAHPEHQTGDVVGYRGDQFTEDEGDAGRDQAGEGAVPARVIGHGCVGFARVHRVQCCRSGDRFGGIVGDPYWVDNVVPAVVVPVVGTNRRECRSSTPCLRPPCLPNTLPSWRGDSPRRAMWVGPVARGGWLESYASTVVNAT